VPLSILNGGLSYWLTDEEQALMQLAVGGHANVVFLGDSITYGLMAGTGKPVWQTLFAPLKADNFAIPGLTTSQVLWQVGIGQVALASPDVVVLMIGTNNLGLGQSPKAAAAGVSAIVDGLRDQLPQTRILLLGVLPRGESPADPLRAEVAAVNGLLAGLDDGSRVRFRDIGGWFLEADGVLSPAVMPDFLHPSLWGYQLYTAAVWQPLMEMLAQ
jgi:lysophospholipase L1-like esterase